jgi:hypothetical protein
MPKTLINSAIFFLLGEIPFMSELEKKTFEDFKQMVT